MTADATTLPPDVEVRLRRRDTAIRWRMDHTEDHDRERLWRAFRTGALRGVGALPPLQQYAVRAGLWEAELYVPFDRVVPNSP